MQGSDLSYKNHTICINSSWSVHYSRQTAALSQHLYNQIVVFWNGTTSGFRTIHSRHYCGRSVWTGEDQHFCWQMLAPSLGKRPHIQNLLIAEWNFQVVGFPLMLNLNVLLGTTTLWMGHILGPINARAQNSPACAFISPQREIKLCMHAYHKMKLLDLARLLFPVGGYLRNKTCSYSSLLCRTGSGGLFL